MMNPTNTMPHDCAYLSRISQSVGGDNLKVAPRLSEGNTMPGITVAVLTDAGGAHVDAYLAGLAGIVEVESVSEWWRPL